jgi:arabinose-5-phosphate isomerase
MNSAQIEQWAKESIQLQSEQVANLSGFINHNFVKAIEHLHAIAGRIVISGIGKSAIIAQKMVATLNSTGAPAIYMHAADAIHGDIGMLQPNDVAIVISKSGESPEIKILVDILKKFENTVIAICGNEQSYLATQAHYLLNTYVSKEACPNNLAPTTSTTAQLVMADTIAICLLKMKGFTKDDFARLHPGGALGKQLFLRVADLSEKNAKPYVLETDSLEKVIIAISANRLGATAVLGANNQLSGIITDGDLRRMLQNKTNYSSVLAQEIMSVNPRQIQKSALASQALLEMRTAHISQLVVLDNNVFDGFIHIQDLLREGII